MSRCPKCNRSGVVQGDQYWCRHCSMIFDDDPDEGGDYATNPARRMERQESRRHKEPTNGRQKPPQETKPLFLELGELFGDRYGRPLPKEVLTIGGGAGWSARLNVTRSTVDNIPPLSAMVYWGDLPAGLLTVHGGTLAAGTAANERTFRQWIKDEREKHAQTAP